MMNRHHGYVSLFGMKFADGFEAKSFRDKATVEIDK
jgi:hypothetical protein